MYTLFIIYSYLCIKIMKVMTDYEARNRDINLRARENRLEQDIVVLEDVHTVPVLNTEYHTHYYYIGMCRSGCTKGQLDYRDIEFKAGDICWIMPDHVLSHQYVSEDYSVLSVFISKSLYEIFKQHGALGKFHYPVRTVRMGLSPEQFEVLANGFKTMGRLAAVSHPQREELMITLCHVQSSLADEFISQQHPDFSQRQLPYEELFERFYTSIVKNHRESREVAFYARQLCLTPKYFAKIIKQTTGITASEWINRYVIVEAKWQLRSKKSIQQIAHYLGFTEHASFSRFFKSYEGISPTEYREKM